MESDIWLAILSIIVPAVLIVGGGAIYHWRFLRTEAREQANQETNYKQKAEDAAWGHVSETIDDLRDECKGLRTRIIMLERENQVLRELTDDSD